MMARKYRSGDGRADRSQIAAAPSATFPLTALLLASLLLFLLSSTTTTPPVAADFAAPNTDVGTFAVPGPTRAAPSPVATHLDDKSADDLYHAMDANNTDWCLLNLCTGPGALINTVFMYCNATLLRMQPSNPPSAAQVKSLLAQCVCGNAQDAWTVRSPEHIDIRNAWKVCQNCYYQGYPGNPWSNITANDFDKKCACTDPGPIDALLGKPCNAYQAIREASASGSSTSSSAASRSTSSATSTSSSASATTSTAKKNAGSGGGGIWVDGDGRHPLQPVGDRILDALQIGTHPTSRSCPPMLAASTTSFDTRSGGGQLSRRQRRTRVCPFLQAACTALRACSGRRRRSSSAAAAESAVGLLLQDRNVPGFAGGRHGLDGRRQRCRPRHAVEAQQGREAEAVDGDRLLQTAARTPYGSSAINHFAFSSSLKPSGGFGKYGHPYTGVFGSDHQVSANEPTSTTSNPMSSTNADTFAL
ncbi:hypothetical protein DFJ73DRAFT_799979, partial [Zopfochytrium polystomum]